jgi:hypothetical protein
MHTPRTGAPFAAAHMRRMAAARGERSRVRAKSPSSMVSAPARRRHIRQPHAGKAALAFHAHSAVSSGSKRSRRPFRPARRGAVSSSSPAGPFPERRLLPSLRWGSSCRVPGDLRAAHLAALTQAGRTRGGGFSLEIIRKIWFHTASRAPRRAQISKSYDNHTIPVSGGQRGKAAAAGRRINFFAGGLALPAALCYSEDKLLNKL